MVVLISFFALALSFLAEYLFKIEPCKLCLLQRYIWIGIFLVSTSKAKKKSLFIPAFAALGILLSSYHTGVVLGVFKDRCSFKKPTTIEEYRESLKRGPVTGCAKNNLAFAKIPAPAWNLILLLIIFFAKEKAAPSFDLSERKVPQRKTKKNKYLIFLN